MFAVRCRKRILRKFLYELTVDHGAEDNLQPTSIECLYFDCSIDCLYLYKINLCDGSGETSSDELVMQNTLRMLKYDPTCAMQFCSRSMSKLATFRWLR